jgi:formate dehydrogenase major subunit
LLLQYIAMYRERAGITVATGTGLDTTKRSTDHTEETP